MDLSNLPSIINNPFSVELVTGINIYYRPSQWSKSWTGNVNFKNGNTSGTQELTPCDTINEIIEQIKIISESLRQRDNALIHKI